MSNRAWMPLHITDYLADTGHLNAAEHGAYLMLIMHYWQNGSLPADERLLARLARMSKSEWDDSRDVLAMLFGENWTHKRIDAELAKADEIIEKRRNAALGRHAKTKGDASAVHVQSKSTDTGVPPRTSEPSSSLRSEDQRGQAAPRPSETDLAFDAWDQMAARTGLAKVRVRSKARVTGLAGVIRQHGLPVLLEAIGRVEASAFCRGENERGWRADLDFLLQPKSFGRLLEGHFDNRAGQSRASPAQSGNAAAILKSNREQGIFRHDGPAPTGPRLIAAR
jgi:uncharacterized protein YdaU (DUF1376 family)